MVVACGIVAFLCSVIFPGIHSVNVSYDMSCWNIMTSFISQVLETATSYAEALDRLSNVTIIAPVYYIIGGVKPGEGAVITRDRLHAKDVWTLDANMGR